VIIGVLNRHTLVGQTIGKKPWRFIHYTESRPMIAGELVVTMGGGELTALDAETGEVEWTVKALGRLRGVDDDGRTTIVSIESLTRARSIVLAIARDGRVVRQIYERALVGSPAVIDDFAFLPYNSDTVVIFDLLEGTEAARVVSKVPVTRAFKVGSDLYFGQDLALRFDDRIVAARRGGGTRIALPARNFPPDTPWMLPGSTTPPVQASKADRIRYYALPDAKLYALAYERLAIGIEAPSGRTRWVTASDSTFVGGTATADSVALCDTAGLVRWFDLGSGREVHRASLKSRVMACAVQSARAPRRPTGKRSESLVAQLAKAIALRDFGLVPMQLELLDDLARIPGEAATKALIELASTSPGMPPARRAIAIKAAELLGRRRSGAGAMVAALEQAASPPSTSGWRWYFEPPTAPVTELARALAALGETRAAPILARLLDHPGMPSASLEAIAEALTTLAGPSERLRLSAFLLRHRCEPREAPLIGAVLAVARALVRIGARDIVVRVATEACDQEAMRTSLLAVAAPQP
jgi:outer membrane protein assembly factor BamB